VKIGRQNEQFHAIARKRGLERFEIDAERASGFGVRADGDSQATRAYSA